MLHHLTVLSIITSFCSQHQYVKYVYCGGCLKQLVQLVQRQTSVLYSSKTAERNPAQKHMPEGLCICAMSVLLPVTAMLTYLYLEILKKFQDHFSCFHNGILVRSLRSLLRQFFSFYFFPSYYAITIRYSLQ